MTSCIDSIIVQSEVISIAKGTDLRRTCWYTLGVWVLGGLGSHAKQLLLFMGAAPIIAIDPLPAVRERALSLAADLAFDPSAQDLREQIFTATGVAGLDIALDYAGFTSVQAQGLSVLARHRKLAFVGIRGQPFKVEDNLGLTIKTRQVLGHCASEARDFSSSINALLPLPEAAEAVERLWNKVGHPVRLVLKP